MSAEIQHALEAPIVSNCAALLEKIMEEAKFNAENCQQYVGDALNNVKMILM